MRSLRLIYAFLFMSASLTFAQQPATSGIFVLHKFAQPIGKETYSIAASGDTYTLRSHFLFTDRSTPVSLETTFTAHTADMLPLSYAAKGKSSRLSPMDDTMTLADEALLVSANDKKTSVTPKGPWFMTDGYSPVAMQEQMMRWWLLQGKPAAFTAYPSGATVHILPAGELTVEGHLLHGYTVGGLIWGQESLWMDEAQDLAALVSIDAEFDHFEALRDAFANDLSTFISAGVKNNLSALKTLSASARMRPAKVLVITGATLEDSTGVAAVKDSVIVMSDGVITAVGSKGKIKVPRGATVLDARGKFAVPGLWDAHAHYEQVEWGPIYLAAGVTSVRDVGNEYDFITTVHDELDRKADPAVGPHLEFAGIIDGSGKDGKRARSLGVVIADTPEQAQMIVTKYKGAGAKQIKIYSSVQPEIVKAICLAAHAQGMTVTGHIPDGMTAVEGINDGMDQINHIQYLIPYLVKPTLGPDGKPIRTADVFLDVTQPKAKELLDVMKQHHTVLDPTIALFETQIHTKPMSELEPGLDHVAPQLYAALNSPAAPAARAHAVDNRWSLFPAMVGAVHAAGIPVIAGTDQAIPGYSLHREMELYVQAGFTPLEALQSATIETARAVGVEKESGSLEVGKRGDVLLLDADPMADIHNTRKVWRTVSAGAVYAPGALWESVGFKP
ncbi:amidohydrolase family protein [Granulicella tundricola]|uniref:Amidohydrolase n=1 Tax=Granulicella tundricola (strain ATCC BAA-1859 / DSM 23138 / MP5ACTX9) TaxID=1198114 RepID=E8X5R9_GRATM|nr:amidohydrolase family protein [Granulicella tundricola]ADW70803.1 amidohydrolase [Granulicella tundricola MP5ACTX9]